MKRPERIDVKSFLEYMGMLMAIVGWVVIAFGVFMLLGAFGNMKTEPKKTVAGMFIFGVVLITLGFAIKPSHNDKTAEPKKETSSVSKKVSSSASSSATVVPETDAQLLNAFKSDLTNGDTNDFVNKYIKLDMKTQSAYYQKFRTVSPVSITGQAFQTNGTGSRLFLYVNTDDQPAVHLDRSNSYDGVQDAGQLHNVFIAKAQPGTFSNVDLMSNVTVQGTLGATNVYEQGKIDMPFDLNDATLAQ